MIKRYLSYYRQMAQMQFVVFFIMIAAALFVRLNGLDQYAFNEDELWHLVVANQENLWDVILDNFREEVHPPLSYIIWHYMLKISHNDLWLRMSEIVPALFLIPSIYLFGRLYFGKKTAAYFMAFLFAFGAMPLVISTTIRAYSMMMLALTWAAIFVQKYCEESDAKIRKKYLINYFLICLIAIELNHAASFIIFSFALILFAKTLREKNQKDFFVITIIHAVLGVLVLGYVLVLKYFFNLGDMPQMFTDRGFFTYLERYLTILMHFPIGASASDFVTSSINLIAFFALILTPILLFEARKWALLNLVLVPIILIVLADYFRLYPFSQITRNNLFLFFSVTIIYAYFIQSIVDFLNKILPLDLLKQRLEDKRSLLGFAQIITICVSVFLCTKFVIKHNSFRNIEPSCLEFSITKSDREILLNKIAQRDSTSDVLVTIVRNLWYWRLQYGDVGHLKILTKNLGSFENEGRVIYFTAFPAREYSFVENISGYQLFFRDLFEHLEKSGKLKEVKSFTFFDIGSKFDYLTKIFHPQFVLQKSEPFLDVKGKLDYQMWREGYDFGWALTSSNQVLERFYSRDSKFSCGRETLILSVKPQFIRQEILSKNFIDPKEFEKFQK